MNDLPYSNEELIAELQRRVNLSGECLRLEEEVRNLSEQLRKSEKGKSRFLSNVRNEIVNPLTSILGLASFIENNSTGEKIKNMSSLIYDQAFTLDFQLRNIIIAAEIEMGEVKPMGTKVDVNALVKDQVNYHKSSREQTNFNFKLDTPESLTFSTDPYILQTILTNLLANAIEYSGENSQIVLEGADVDGVLSITIKDFGAGITQEEQKVIFDRFEQAESGLTKSHKGHGLGLSIVNELLNILNGSIQLWSTPHEGTTVKIKIPSLPSDVSSVMASTGNDIFFTDEQEF
ncbi:sensor histidine kinase [Fulvivirga lutimaris]|uniref:sensor histidine kinase n=1 Tax=Fulvivirga lutimaris TaxID=1819566 RepID=UPI0012BB53E3|nr:HAMP domain-containing sensor histidine kinase [Fulvivirga lutimaris]MTI41317.1 HAMP domain-containing histidine kinase [Fulvivirga lutimaris]